MRPEDDSCMDIVKEIYPRSKFYHLIVGNLQEIKKKLTYPTDGYSNLFLNTYINRHVHAEYLKMIAFYSPFGIRHVYLY